MSNVTDFKINDMVQQADNPNIAGRTKFNGVVTGFTVNSLGEAILLVDMTVRRVYGNTMAAGGYEPVAFTHNEFWHRISPIHPSGVEPFHDITNLMEDS
jgi:hypothetical protein